MELVNFGSGFLSMFIENTYSGKEILKVSLRRKQNNCFCGNLFNDINDINDIFLIPILLF